MKKSYFSKKAVLLIAVLYSAIFWFDYKLKLSQADRDAVQLPAQPNPSENTEKPVSDIQPGLVFPAQPTFAVATESQAELTEKVKSVLRKTENRQRFIQNKGQLPAAVKYYSDASGLQLLVTNKSIRLVATKRTGKDEQQKVQRHSVDLSFTGSNELKPQPVAGNLVTYNYMEDEKHMYSNVQSYGELLLPNIYDGVSLRLYSNEAGDVEFDWLVNNPEDYKKIQMQFGGQDYLQADSDGSLTVGLRFNEMKLHIPESYQVANNEKKNVHFSFATDDNTASFALAKNETLLPGAPLVIDPSISGATLFGDNAGGFPVDFEAAAAIVKDAAGNVYAALEIYFSQVTPAYINNAPGYDQTLLNHAFNGTDRTGLIVKLTGNICTGFTFFGTNSAPKTLKIFPNGRLIVSGAVTTTSGTAIPTTPSAYIVNPRPAGSRYQGFVAVFSADLTALHYSSYLPGINTITTTDQKGASCVEILDDQTYFVAGTVNAPAATAVPAGFISAGAPDISQGSSSQEMYIARFSGAGYNTLNWATYVGGGGLEYYGGLKLTPDKSKLAFCGQSNNVTGWPAVTPGNIASTFIQPAIFFGTIDPGPAVPAAFDFLSFITGTAPFNAVKMDVTNSFYYLFYQTASSTLPGTAGVPAVYDATFNGSIADMAITKVPIDGTASGGTARSTYLGGTGYDFSSIGIAVDESINRVFVVGTSSSNTTYPTVNMPGSDYFKSTFTPNLFNLNDYVISYLTTDLSQLVYSTFLGGAGTEEGISNNATTVTGSNTSVFYDASTGEFSFIGIITTPAGLPTSGWGPIWGPSSFDSSVIGVNPGNRIPFIFNLTGNRNRDFGDAPATYDAGTPAGHTNSLNAFKQDYVRFGNTIDLDNAPQSSTDAQGDGADEDGVSTLPALAAGSAGSYTVNVSAFKNTVNPATPGLVYGWIDFNGNGVFELSERTSTSFTTNNTQTSVSLVWNLSNYTCGSSIVEGQSYLRIRTGTINGEVSTPTGSAANGEVEDYSLSILGTDFGDLPVGAAPDYPAASAISLPNSDPAKIWLGDNLDKPTKECTSISTPDASGDAMDNGFLFPSGIQSGVLQNFPLTLNSNTPTIVYYGVWFDWDRDGFFDDFVNGSQATASPATVSIAATPPANAVQSFAVRVIARTVPIIATDFNLTGFVNGEVEDYVNLGVLISLPAKGLLLRATPVNNDVQLDWKTIQEINSKQFEIQRSTDATNYKTIGTTAAAGNSSTIQNYQFTDRNVNESSVFYRIRLTDIDGKATYSNQVVVRRQVESQNVLVYPNPVLSGGKFRIEFTKSGNFDMQLVNAAGSMVLRQQVTATSGQVIEVSRMNYPAGTYFLKIINSTTREESYKKLILQ